jgi:two-component system nitrogen regulation sensor histidine kinase NtrY
MPQKRSGSVAEAFTAGLRSMASERSAPLAKMKRSQKFKLNFEHRVFLRALLIWLPSFVLLIILCWRSELSPLTRWTVVVLLAAVALVAAFSLRNFVLRPLQTLSNMLSAIREEDYSVKARGGGHQDALSQLVLETNALAESLRERQYRDIEASALMKQVMTEIDVAIFIFDLSGTLRLINRAGEELIGRPAEQVVGKSATDLGLGDYLNKPDLRDASANFGGRDGRWQIQTRAFRESGVPHTLLLVSDLSRALRTEEREAWQRITRVLGHELNNSLAPIKSIAGTLRSLTEKNELPSDWKADVTRGLDVIISRSDALARFMQGYTRLARLPVPTKQKIEVRELVTHAAAADGRLPVELHAGPDASILADRDQLEQVLINLVKNAIDATLSTRGKVELGWTVTDHKVKIYVRDEGEGITNSANLFVPFFTTKPQGSGIGLALSRQIAEAHGGALTLENRTDRLGCIATLVLET